jgi:outer membrane lipoprotein-sorting protein
MKQLSAIDFGSILTWHFVDFSRKCFLRSYCAVGLAIVFCLGSISHGGVDPGLKKQDEVADPSIWVQKADEIRNPSNSYEMVVKVIDADLAESVLQVFLKGQDKTLIVTKEPLRDKGRNMLMLDRDFQTYIPNLKRSLRLSLSQKLSGQVANGDISRTRWFGDYDVTLEKTTGEHQLLLKGKKENLTYASLRLWLEVGSNRPLRAEYLALDGQTVLKRAYFEEYKLLEGAMRPTSLRIEDLNKSTSFVKIQSIKSKPFEDSFFTVRNMEMIR